ncbi:uncharacterized protein A4U43_C01F5930 [Asparagus officinalis]|uniref:Hyaluronan/mRNA-binding protein domain-containing protein n=1 Tax=Asparagus officinalis TaxID=4686 RepID=A0A5P1FM58_ASPOF|nr:uncharacterized protein A4U43_C01F5930 [Asparagus officinalis]
MGEVKQAESVPPVSSAKKPAQAAQAKESMPKEAKKEVKKEPAKEEEEAPKPKPKNSLDLLPPSKMILDEWKRLSEENRLLLLMEISSVYLMLESVKQAND